MISYATKSCMKKIKCIQLLMAQLRLFHYGCHIANNPTASNGVVDPCGIRQAIKHGFMLMQARHKVMFHG